MSTVSHLALTYGANSPAKKKISMYEERTWGFHDLYVRTVSHFSVALNRVDGAPRHKVFQGEAVVSNHF